MNNTVPSCIAAYNCRHSTDDKKKNNKNYRISLANYYLNLKELCDIAMCFELIRTSPRYRFVGASQRPLAILMTSNTRNLVVSFYKNYTDYVIKFSRKRGAGFPSPSIHPSHLENIFSLFIREHDFLFAYRKSIT